MSVLALVTIALYAYCESGKATVSIVGDIMLDRGVERVMDERGYGHPYEKVSRIFLEDDITLGNLECPITSIENPALKRLDIVFMAEKENARELKKAGFDVLNLANNHSMDQRNNGLKDTIDILNYQGISTLGAGENREKARAHVVKKIRGVRIGILGYSVFPPEGFIFSEEDYDVARIDVKSLKDEVSMAKEDCDFLIITVHWGNEYENYPSEIQRDLAHMMVESGADLIVGHHPHVIQSVEKYMDKYIFYSMGNFVFDRQAPKGTDISAILQLDISKNGCENIKIIPVKIENAQPRPAYGAERDYIFKRLMIYSNGMGAQGELGKWAESRYF
ncbi:CapA family protein [Peptoclostridium litorale]|uniref:CapA family protein n=1 Tax=Peptoclostridium litorale TaxID=1557 RepID=UPI00135671B6|nr:CapA family protein [Peptoclostridium litorale]